MHTLFGKQTAELLCHSWNKILGANCRVQGCDFKTLLHRLSAKNFDIGLIRWIPWVNDPFYTLNAFVNPESPFSIECDIGKKLSQLMTAAQMEKNVSKRDIAVKEIEEMLVDEQPIIPLFHTYFQAMKKKSLKIHPNHVLMDFKWARLETE